MKLLVKVKTLKVSNVLASNAYEARLDGLPKGN